MANIFLLGPGWWDAGKGVPPPDTPLNFRKRIAEIWRKDGHTVLLMEEAADVKGETILQKFDRLLRQGVTHVVIYWPPLAKMATTYTEMVLLCDRQEFLIKQRINVWFVYHVSVASISGDEFKVLEPKDRSRYLEAVVKLTPHAVGWENEADLYNKIQLLSTEL